MTLHIIVPMGGWATRLRPQTWSKPKPLVSVAGRTFFDHLLDSFRTVPDPASIEYTFIVSPFLGRIQMQAYVAENYPDLKVDYVVQEEKKGQSHALWLAGAALSGPTLVIFADTLIDTDFSFLPQETLDVVAWVKPVPDPRRFGVAEVNPHGRVTRLIEKPQVMDNNLAVVGCYYFREGQRLLAAINEQMQRGIMLKGEYFLTDTINIMLEAGASMRTEQVDVWLDTGTIAALLETNRFLLERSHTSTDPKPGVRMIDPVFIHPSAEVVDSTIGPFASIGADCKVTGSHIEDSILESGAQVESIALKGSVIGRQSIIRGLTSEAPPLELNIGDNCSVLF